MDEPERYSRASRTQRVPQKYSNCWTLVATSASRAKGLFKSSPFFLFLAPFCRPSHLSGFPFQGFTARQDRRVKGSEPRRRTSTRWPDDVMMPSTSEMWKRGKRKRREKSRRAQPSRPHQNQKSRRSRTRLRLESTNTTRRVICLPLRLLRFH